MGLVAEFFPGDRDGDAPQASGREDVNADITALAIAVPGVAGTLAAPVLTQRLAMRARQQELDAQHASAVGGTGHDPR